jgi:hypothetical protein
MNRGAAWASQRVPFQAPDPVDRAVDTANTIADRPTLIVIQRDGANNTKTDLAPQTVRLDINQNVRAANELKDTQIMLELTEQYLIVMGYKDHPTIPNTDIRRGDRFYHQRRIYEITELLDGLPGRLLASAKVKP